MMKKTLILGLTVCSLFIVSMGSVVAEEEKITTVDDMGDVIDENNDFVSRPNIDIIEVNCIKSENEVELQLKLADGGKIRNSEFFIYYILLSTAVGEYEAAYSDSELVVSDPNYEEIETAEYSGVGTDTLSISFDLLSSDEECLLVSAMTVEFTIAGSLYGDEAPNEEYEISADARGPYEGKAGESISFSGSVSGGIEPYTYLWYFGDGDTSNEQNPEHIYEETGEYEVTLTVTDDLGSTDSDTATATVSGDGTEDNTDDTNSDSGQGEGDSSEHQLFLFIALVAIICIVGAIVLIWIIRR